MVITYQMMKEMSAFAARNSSLNYEGVYVGNDAVYVAGNAFCVKFQNVETPHTYALPVHKDTKTIFSHVKKAKQLDYPIEIVDTGVNAVGVTELDFIYPILVGYDITKNRQRLDTCLLVTDRIKRMEKIIKECTPYIGQGTGDNKGMFTKFIYNFGLLQELLDLYPDVIGVDNNGANPSLFRYDLSEGTMPNLIITRDNFIAILAPWKIK